MKKTKKPREWGTSEATRTIRALQDENRAMLAALIDCNIQAATNADQCDDCEWVMRRSGHAAETIVREVLPKKLKKGAR